MTEPTRAAVRSARHRAAPRRGDRVRTAIGVLGELLVTAGVLVLLFLAWHLGYASLREANTQVSEALALQQRFRDSVDPGVLTGPAPDGTVFALVRIPRLGGPDWVRPVYEGTGLDVLAKGVGRYTSTQLPGQIGNLGLAGHRTTHGHPFFDIDTLVPGDVVVVETQPGYAVYRVERTAIVSPFAVEVIAPVPQQPDATATEAWLTLTSCEPKFSARSRYVVFAQLERSYTRAQGLPLDLLAVPTGA